MFVDRRSNHEHSNSRILHQKRYTCITLIGLILIANPFFFVCYASPPIALHQLIEVKPNEEVILRLHGHDWDGDKTTSYIKSLPESGTLHQLTYVFDKHGYDPKAGALITSVPTKVTGSENRLIYKRPDYDYEDEFRGEWGRFNYTVSDKEGESYEGTVVLVQPSHVVVGSDFLLSDDNWSTIDNRNQSVVYDPTTRGTELGYFIHATENSININREGNDIDRWSFLLPKKYYGWHGIVYGGSFDFTLSSYAGDYTEDKKNRLDKLNLVEIYCATCDIFRGVTIGFPFSSTSGFQGLTKAFSLQLDESSGWLKDPKNVNFDWIKPTKCEIIQVLSGISRITILGDFTNWYETIIIDDVKFKVSKPKGRYNIPICAQETPDARKCSC